mgnify:CR=1 FL=1
MGGLSNFEHLQCKLNTPLGPAPAPTAAHHVERLPALRPLEHLLVDGVGQAGALGHGLTTALVAVEVAEDPGVAGRLVAQVGVVLLAQVVLEHLVALVGVFRELEHRGGAVASRQGAAERAAVGRAVGGGGGGRPNMAQAGGKNPAGIPEAVAKVKEILESQIS